MGYTNINIFIVVVTDQVLVTLSNVTSKTWCYSIVYLLEGLQSW